MRRRAGRKQLGVRLHSAFDVLLHVQTKRAELPLDRALDLDAEELGARASLTELEALLEFAPEYVELAPGPAGREVVDVRAHQALSARVQAGDAVDRFPASRRMKKILSKPLDEEVPTEWMAVKTTGHLDDDLAGPAELADPRLQLRRERFHLRVLQCHEVARQVSRPHLREVRVREVRALELVAVLERVPSNGAESGQRRNFPINPSCVPRWLSLK